MATPKKVRESLIKQLQDKGANVEHFISLVDDYVYYWNQERLMQKDVKEKGRVYESISAAGKSFEKDNPSVKNAPLYNKQKLAILKELGLTTDKVMSDDDNEL